MREQATAMAVPSSIRSVAVAPRASGTNGSCLTSVVQTPSNPSRSACRMTSRLSAGLSNGIPKSTFTCHLLRRTLPPPVPEQTLLREAREQHTVT